MVENETTEILPEQETNKIEIDKLQETTSNEGKEITKENLKDTNNPLEATGETSEAGIEDAVLDEGLLDDMDDSSNGIEPGELPSANEGKPLNTRLKSTN